jgi:hypothetical protein
MTLQRASVRLLARLFRRMSKRLRFLRLRECKAQLPQSVV